MWDTCDPCTRFRTSYLFKPMCHTCPGDDLSFVGDQVWPVNKMPVVLTFYSPQFPGFLLTRQRNLSTLSCSLKVAVACGPAVTLQATEDVPVNCVSNDDGNRIILDVLHLRIEDYFANHVCQLPADLRVVCAVVRADGVPSPAIPVLSTPGPFPFGQVRFPAPMVLNRTGVDVNESSLC